MKRKKRFAELDSLRGLAAVSVATYHYGVHFNAAPFSTLFRPIYTSGYLLVDFFFVLSGFVIARAYLSQGRDKTLCRNVVERIARLYPLHFITLIFVTGVYIAGNTSFIYEHNDLYHFILNLLLLNRSGLQAGLSFNGPSWSISVEFYVNILFFLIIARPLARGFMFASLAFAAMASVYVVSVPMSPLAQVPVDALGAIELPRGMLGFFIGVLLSRIPQPTNQTSLARVGWDMLFLGMGGVLVFLMLLDSLGLVTLILLNIAVFPVIVWASINGNLFTRFLRLPALVYIGTISYSIYLIHFPLQILVKLITDSQLEFFDFDHPLTLFGFVIATLAIASLTYHRFERPAQKTILRLWVNRQRANRELLPERQTG